MTIFDRLDLFLLSPTVGTFTPIVNLKKGVSTQKARINWKKSLWVQKMTFDEIYRFFQNPPPIYLNKELAVCYILSVFLGGESYGSELVGRLEEEYSVYRLSDTVLYNALKFLEDKGIIKGNWKKVPGRGRPRRMYQILPQWQSQAEDLASLWYQYVDGGHVRPKVSEVKVQTES